MENEALLALTADIITAHVSNNAVPATQLPKLIETVFESLTGLGQTPHLPEEPRTPAVSLRASVKPDGIVCLECGKKFKTIKRHISADHQLTAENYRTRWNLPASYPFVAPEYAERRSALAKTIGLGRKPGKKAADKAQSASSEVAAESPQAPVAVSESAPATTAKPVRARKAPVKAKAVRKPKTTASE